MLNLDKRPFNFLPLNEGDLFDLSCEYSISLLQKISMQFQMLINKSREITQELPKGSFSLYRDAFDIVENLIDNYSRLVKCCKLSLGQNVGRIQSKQIIFKRFTYSPNTSLQDIFVHGLRNTSQHFEERLQDYHSKLDPFLRLSYNGQYMNWNITFGNGGYRHSGNDGDQKEVFNSENLHFHSYKQENNTLIKIDILLADVWTDVLKIANLIEENMEYLIVTKNICCPPIRNLSVFMTH